jgi:hypothetical protein
MEAYENDIPSASDRIEDAKEFKRPSLNDSMEPLEPVESFVEEESEVTPYKKDLGQVEKVLSQALNLANDGQFHESTCSICCSPLREEAEDLWDQGRATAPIKKLYKEKSSQKINDSLIKNHMKNHKDGGVRELKKVEYVDRVKRLYGSGEITTLDRLNLSLAIITDQLLEINSLEPSGDKSIADIQKIKSGETNKLMATFNNIVKLQATISGEMRDSGEIISIPRDTFLNVFNDAIINARNDREREIITGILDGLKSV